MLGKTLRNDKISNNTHIKVVLLKTYMISFVTFGDYSNIHS